MKKGQFSIIAALLVAVVLIAAVITTYSIIRNNLLQDQSQLMSAVDETNLAIKSVLGYTVGYYGSVLRVTGDSSYAYTLAANYLQDGMANIAAIHPDWGISFVNLSKPTIHAHWYTNASYCTGDLTANYDLVGLGMRNIDYSAACKLEVHVEEPAISGQIRLTILKDEGEPLINLGTQNFKFFNYSYANSTWGFVNPSTIQSVYANATYVINPPAGIDPEFYTVQVEDTRGLIVTASSYSRHVLEFEWNSTMYSVIENGTVPIELLQNGTARWFGQNIVTNAVPIPPVPVKAIRVNETVNGIDQEVPFQIEDWESDYRVPLGLSSNSSLFGRNNMIVFLVNNDASHNVSKVTVWWDGSDTAVQTPYSIYNPATSPFSNCTIGKLSNGILTLTISGLGVFTVNSALAGGITNATAKFLSVNNQSTNNGALEAYPILNGIVRDIVHQEAEWEGGGIPAAPNVYAQIIITLPAKTTYYTYSTRVIFVNSTQPRTLSSLSLIQLSSGWVSGTARSLTENGTSDGLPIVGETLTGQTYLFFNFSDPITGWAHHWSECTDEKAATGIMFTNDSNFRLYDPFDIMSGQKTGALNATVVQRSNWVAPMAVCDKCGEDSSQLASNTMDGNTGTYWRHSSTDNHWIIFDMGKIVSISKIRIYQSSTASQRWGQTNGIEIYVSNNTSIWISVWNGTLDASGWQESAAFSAQARYIKLYSRSTSSSQRLYEVNVRINEKQTTIEFNPVDRYPISFTYPLDLTWNGAIVTFDGTMPVYKEDSTGLWILTEYPPAVTVTAED